MAFRHCIELSQNKPKVVLLVLGPSKFASHGCKQVQLAVVYLVIAEKCIGVV